MIVWQISYVILFQHTDIDDSYYLAQANTFAFTGSVGTVEPSSGLAGFSASNQYALVSFEILYALIHNVFGVNIAFLAHTVWPVFAIVCHYAVIRAIARKVSRSLHLEFAFFTASSTCMADLRSMEADRSCYSGSGRENHFS